MTEIIVQNIIETKRKNDMRKLLTLESDGRTTGISGGRAAGGGAPGQVRTMFQLYGHVVLLVVRHCYVTLYCLISLLLWNTFNSIFGFLSEFR